MLMAKAQHLARRDRQTIFVHLSEDLRLGTSRTHKRRNRIDSIQKATLSFWEIFVGKRLL